MPTSASDVYEMSSSPRPEPDHHRLLATLARHGRLAAAATLFSSAVRTTRALNTILAALCSSPALVCVAPSVLLLAAPTAAPDAATFRVLASALCRARRPSAAADLLRLMPPLLLDPDYPLCAAVLSSLCAHAPATHAAAFLHDMSRWGLLVPSPSSGSGHHHRAVLRALLRDGLPAEAYEVLTEAMASDGVAPRPADFELLLRVFADAGDFAAVDQAFDEMLLRGIVPDTPVYAAYLAALCGRGDLPGARRMLGCMARAGCPPDARAFGVVVAGCARAGDHAAAGEVAREAVRRGLRWDAPALAELVGELRASGHLAAAQGTLLDLFLDGGCAGVDASAFGRMICASEEDCAPSPSLVGIAPAVSRR
ncbi:pentatricopeptide repeat-containing protein At2g38420, mitochondrial-like [Brachypodium distachyon]|uniref:Pentacotripeptide-repeat region of PRORP domain-containing protein n=1 Tax=Brachypodium distachyon TaxID=15368 RepID=A0A2K2CU75_BRADI|nr:pentatricopeptide repeat-containing protein At2g38420, mitochondrial-like [Brachypodium distachyon]PNT65578.1 hypothetical protein BRADI_4g44671v3 [Brachypodium distachyon]|eukprot:XP_010239557.3 pentatricopeptide repeat-containing protein At2g38420, mitochondrial-like [Brachypodium distachyon]